jgi:hypothetical protein
MEQGRALDRRAENRFTPGTLQRGELQGRGLVVGRDVGVAVFHRPVMALTFDPCEFLKRNGPRRGSKLTLYGTDCGGVVVGNKAGY